MTVTLDKSEIETLIYDINNILRRMNCNEKEVKQYEKLLRKFNRALTPIKVSSRKQKGRELQKFVCKRISEITNIPYNQSDDDCLIHSREMGQKGADVILRGKVRELFDFDIECKKQEKINLNEFINQAMSNAKYYNSWLLVIDNKTLKEPVVVLNWYRFEQLILKR